MSTPTSDPEIAVVSRINANLIPKAAGALAALIARTGCKQVDVVNRALQVYDMIDAELKGGASLYIHQADGTMERVHIL